MELVNIKAPRVIPSRAGYRWAKRAMDISLCLLSLPVTIPILALCAIAIYLDSPGPALFIQERLGKGGQPFRIIKFRTMCVDLDTESCREFMKKYVNGRIGSNGTGHVIFKPVKDEQITRVGRFLRKSSLDELPQIINVLRGEMSIVGPRPNVVWEVEEYRPWHHERMEVLPGITGLAQVRGRSCIDFGTLVRADIDYIENRSLLLDLKILWWTAIAILKARGTL